MKHKRTKIIACRTVIEEMQHLLPPDMETLTIEAGLHLNPEKLKSALKTAIDDITVNTETIILGYGLCSMGVVGLKAAHSSLVIPRMDDCIAMFLGTRAAYREELNQEPGTYFLSKGWIDAGISLLDELEMMEERYDPALAERLMKRMLQNYKRLAFIDMGSGDLGKYRQSCQKTAMKFNLQYQEIKGTTAFLDKMCNGPWDDELVVAPPGHEICLADFGMAPDERQ